MEKYQGDDGIGYADPPVGGLNHEIVIPGKSGIAFTSSDDGEYKATAANNSADFSSQEKSHWGADSAPDSNDSVPQTDTGGLVEYTKAIGRKRFKELGKTAGRNLWEMPCQVPSGTWPQLKTLTDCLTKTQVSAKPKGNV